VIGSPLFYKRQCLQLQRSKGPRKGQCGTQQHTVRSHTGVRCFETMWGRQLVSTTRGLWGPVQRLAIIWTVRGSKPGEERNFYSPHPPREILVPNVANFPGFQRSERGAEHHFHPAPTLRISRAISLLPLCASTACYSETLTVLIIVLSRLYDVTFVRVFLSLMQEIKPVRKRLAFYTHTGYMGGRKEVP
jgi:hypothetical protein